MVSDVLMEAWGREGVTLPNSLKKARKLVKSRPCFKGNGHSIFRGLFFFLVTVNGQMVKTPPPNEKYLGTPLIMVAKLLFFK